MFALLIKIFFNILLSDRSGAFTWIKESIFYFPRPVNHNTIEMIHDPSWTLVIFGSDLN